MVFIHRGHIRSEVGSAGAVAYLFPGTAMKSCHLATAKFWPTILKSTVIYS